MPAEACSLNFGPSANDPESGGELKAKSSGEVENQLGTRTSDRVNGNNPWLPLRLLW